MHHGAWSVWQGNQKTKNWEPSSISLICQSRNHISMVLSVVTSGPGWKWNQFFKPLITCQEIALWEHGVCLWQCVAHLNWSFIILLSCSCAREWQKPEAFACGYSTCSLNPTHGWDMTRPRAPLVLTHAGLHEEAERFIHVSRSKCCASSECELGSSLNEGSFLTVFFFLKKMSLMWIPKHFQHQTCKHWWMKNNHKSRVSVNSIAQAVCGYGRVVI